jgi:hypothetical protein
MPKYKRKPEAMAKELRRDWDDNESRYERTQKVIIERARRYLYSLLRRCDWTLVVESSRSVRIQTNLSKSEYDSFLEITLLAQGAEEKRPWDMKILNPRILHDGKFRGWDYTAELGYIHTLDGKPSFFFVTLTETVEKIKEFLGTTPKETKNVKV